MASQQVSTQVVEALRELFSTDSQLPSGLVMEEAPDVREVIFALELVLSLLLPSGGIGAERVVATTFAESLQNRITSISEVMEVQVAKAFTLRARTSAEQGMSTSAESVVEHFLLQLPQLRKSVISDIQAAYEGDPAAANYAEVMLAYPGLLAVTTHRIAHELYALGIPVIPRIMSEWVHSRTGIDIHPGAKIGSFFFIDHGTGVVIGETANIGTRVKLYQGVTLGAKSFTLDSEGKPVKGVRRHPTVEDDVVIYANATILGGDTVIGRGSVIGGNVFITESIPQYSVVTRGEHGLRIKSATNDVEGK